MHRLLALLIPIVVLATSSPRAANPANVAPAELGKHWAASTQAEQNRDYTGALESMKSFQQRGGDPFLTMLRVGWLQFQAGDYAKSSQSYGRAVSLKPTSLNALLGSLNAAEALQDVRKTALVAEAVLRVEPTNYRALMLLAGMYFAQKDYRKAAAGYGRVLLTYPDDPDALSGAAWSALRMGDKAAALSTFTLLLSMSPQYPSAQEGYDLASGAAH